MSTAQPVCEDQRSLAEYVTSIRCAIIRDWRTVFLFAAAGALIGAVVAFSIPDLYRSTGKLMPPDQQAISSVSALNALSGQLPAIGGSGLLSSRTAGATSIGILTSRTILDQIVDAFDLRKVYGKRFLEQTRIKLASRTYIEEERKNGIITISVVDSDRSRARAIAVAYITDLNQLLIALSTSGARREREFLQARLVNVKQSLDESTRALSEFSSRNAMIDLQKQGSATLETAERVEAQLSSEESEQSALEAVFAPENVRVRSQKAKIGKLYNELHQITGQGAENNRHDLSKHESFPSVRKLPMLGETYYALSRQMSVKESIYATLEKQFELARVQEAKEIPAVKILDEPDLPERRSFPNRILIILFSTVCCVVAFLVRTVFMVISTSSLVSSGSRSSVRIASLVSESTYQATRTQA